ncbi:VOC family protein [Nitriliruptoraceae bacterium ZYF776]|nr:VOC family protein [Profundirhabdus halotolerans]
MTSRSATPARRPPRAEPVVADRAADLEVPPRLTGVLVGDEPAAWQAARFPVVGDRAAVGPVTLRFDAAAEGRGVLGWELDPVQEQVVDGLRPAAVGPAAGASPASPYAAVDHLVVATPDLERTTAALARVGLSPRRTVDAARGDAGVRYRFFLLGTALLEVIGPREPEGDGPARFVGVAFTAPDLAEVADLATGPPKPAVQAGREIVTLRTRELGIGVPVAVLSPRPPRR